MSERCCPAILPSTHRVAECHDHFQFIAWESHFTYRLPPSISIGYWKRKFFGIRFGSFLLTRLTQPNTIRATCKQARACAPTETEKLMSQRLSRRVETVGSAA